jgi:predicted esterase
MKSLWIVVALMMLASNALFAEPFFKIKTVDFLRKQKDKSGVFKISPVLDKDGKPTGAMQREFVPCLRVEVITAANIKSSNTYAKVYFYDTDNHLIARVYSPSTEVIGDQRRPTQPVFYSNKQSSVIYFAVPDIVLKQPKWTALVVFGDQYQADARALPANVGLVSLDFTEKSQYENYDKTFIRKTVMDPLVEYVINTKVSNQPQITLMLRPPIGMTDASQAKGVLALCALAGSVDEIKRKLQGIEKGDEMNGVLKFAEDHQLIILCWGARTLRAHGTTWDELDPETRRNTEKNFDELADKWDQGVDALVQKYGLPDHNYLLTGVSEAAQYATRLALRKPNRFLAISVHIPNGFDEPRPEAAKTLWCVTMGELDFCHDRSLRFYAKCRELHYPIIYKAFIGIGHAWHPSADTMRDAFFEWALSIQDQREKYEAELADPLMAAQAAARVPWPDEFRHPPFVGDVVNQEVYPADQRDMVPQGFQVDLPTKQIADIWNTK